MSASAASEATSSSAAEAMDEDDNSPEVRISIVNIVATANLGTTIELPRLQQTLKIAEYNPTRFQAVIMRIREPKATALVFRTGKLIVTGLKTIPESETSTKKFVAIIQKAGFQNAKFDQYQIQNMTATCNAGFPISLEGLMLANSKFATYEPELFPGLVYRMTDPKICLLIFVSGKVVITGAKTTDHLTMAISKIYNHLFEFRKKNIISQK